VVNSGPQPEFCVNVVFLEGLDPTGFEVRTVRKGVYAENYRSLVISDPTTTSYIFRGLKTGAHYYGRMRVANNQGFSAPVYSTPIFAIPSGVPGLPTPPFIEPYSQDEILITYEENARPRGNDVSSYFLEVSSSSNFSTVVVSIDVPSRNPVIQRVLLNAVSLPWSSSSYFTLSLGGFYGDFTNTLGIGTLVQVRRGSTYLTRSFGTTNLASALPPGEYFMVSGRKFRVCLDIYSDIPLDGERIAVCSPHDAMSSVVYDGTDSSHEPVFLMDTALGSIMQPMIGDTDVVTINMEGVENDITSFVHRGDLIRIGHPLHGETFRVSTDLKRPFNSHVVPLALITDPSIDASLSSKALSHSPYEVQMIEIKAKNSSVTLTPCDSSPSVF